MSAPMTPDRPVCSQEAARAAGLDVAPSPTALLAMAELIVSSWGDRTAEPDDVAACVADAGAQLARALPLVLAEMARLDAEGTELYGRLTGANLTVWEEQQDNARLRLALVSAKRRAALLRERVAELEAAATCPSRMTVSSGTSQCALPVRHRGDHRNAAANHFWDDAVRARPTKRHPMTADEWNAQYAVGTPVLAYPGTRDTEPLDTVTRTPAWTLGHGAPVVSVEGAGGGIPLTHIDPVDPPEVTP